jgi:RHS repeat-associated protein
MNFINSTTIAKLNYSKGQYYAPDVISCSDYLPFGQVMPNRHGNDNQYRYGFQGQERDNEIKGDGNHINFEFRGNDPRTGRMWSVDPLSRKYPHNSPYAFSENRVIDALELEGREALLLIKRELDDGSTVFKIIADYTVKNNAKSDFQLRVPVGTVGNDAEQIFKTDGNGVQDFGYKELQNEYGNGSFQKGSGSNDLYVNGKVFDAKGINGPGDTYGDVNFTSLVLDVSNLTPNQRKLVPVSNTKSLDFSQNGDFEGDKNVQSFNMSATQSNDGVTEFKINYDDNGIPNTFSVVDEKGNILKDSGGKAMKGTGTGEFNFSVPSGTNFKIQVTGDKNIGKGDAFSISGKQTTKETKSVISNSE